VTALRLVVALVRPRTRARAQQRLRRALAVRLVGPDALRPARPARRARRARPKASPPAPLKIDARYPGLWARLAGVLLDGPVAADRTAVDMEAAGLVARQARLHRAHARLAQALARGDSLETATYEAVDALASAKDWNAAWSLAAGIGRAPGGATAGAVGQAVLLHRRRQIPRVWSVVAHLADAELAQHIPVEAVDGALATGTAESAARAVAIARHGEALPAISLVDLAGRFLAFGRLDVAGELVSRVHGRPAEELAALDERHRRSLELIEVWLGRPAKSVPDGAVPVAVVDYQTPDQVLASGNLGDYIQTLSFLGNLVRHAGVTFTGEGDLGELAGELQHAVRPDLRDMSLSGHVHLLDVNREFSSADELPPDTWMIAFGWHMHPLYDLRYDFPYHPNIRPLFVSFHLNRLGMLNDEALAYLREHGPVGCRDWTTVYLLLGAGVDAFFTGCLTTTVDALFPPREEVYAGDGAVAVIDRAKADAGAPAASVRWYTHQSDDYRHMSITAGVRAARETLGRYQRELSRVVTRRLHAYLPLVALGVPVEFRPGRAGDVRFPGLAGLEPGDAALIEIQHRIRNLVSEMLGTIVAGTSPEAVYANWRRLTADHVAAAKERFAAHPQEFRTAVDVEGVVSVSRRERQEYGPHDRVDDATTTEIVLCFDERLQERAPVTIQSIVDNTSGAVRLWVLGRGLHENYGRWLAGAFPDLPITVFSCDHIDYGDVARIPDRITVSTMDRLILPHLLPTVSRAIYVDIDTLVLGDIAELARLDLEGHPIAARDSNVPEMSEWRAAAARLPEDRALELQRRMLLSHGWGRAALNAGVLVLDLDRMRKDDFTATYPAWVEHYGLHDQDVMLAYAGADRLALDPRWNALPVLEEVSEPKLIHWAMLSKPWEAPLTFQKETWQTYADRLAARAGAPPVKEKDPADTAS
jgi:lipopolysaccharide biosynthesis glycosyltransferase